ncbi:membrane protein [Paenibacillus sp. 598K]|uniref:YitT family protein n=1 Tax=Paenibacillus sp. 598K TaxID=1117987 RepID=UPI000FF90631|nr:YitT family protein [Paenibacillus sp. 598K]GBF72852.1 membrane protein [Paenibacillus sp. 598K]
MKQLHLIGLAASMLAGSLLVAVGFNQFLIPLALLSGGISGVSMIIGYATGANIGWLYFVLNLPVLIWGWLRLGRPFIAWSIFSVLAATVLLQVVPVRPLVTDLLLGSLFGGLLVGIGSGIALRLGGSSGGFDIIASIITRKRDVPVGTLIFLLNGLVVLLLGLQSGDWRLALYSMLSIYAAGRMVDWLHIRHLKVTVFIVTSRTQELKTRLLQRPRGVTVIRTRGAYSDAEKDMLMTVTTRYELVELRRLITELDPGAFVNIVETVGVMGEFRK